MKKSLLALLSVILILSFMSYGLIKFIGTNKKVDTKSTHNTLVTSFYPEYIIVKNIIDSCDDINLINMTSETTGCLHDYQITSKDMKTLTNCDALVINGGGMEPFIDDINKSLPDLPIIDSSEGINLLEGTHSHDHEHSDSCEDKCNYEKNHNSHDIPYNSHIWLDPNNYIKQINTITSNLCTLYPKYKDIFNKNSKTYIAQVNNLKAEIKALDSLDVILFHDSFAYLADSFHLNIVDTISIDSDTTLSAGTIADVINTINEHNIKVLLSEKQFKDSITKSISKETDAKVYILDSLVTGSNDKNAYIDGMKSNIETLNTIHDFKEQR